MEQEVESLFPVSDGQLYYVYGIRVGEMEENAKSQDGGDNMQSISILKLNKLRFIIFFNL